MTAVEPAFCPPPCDWGAPKKYDSWRERQDELFWDIVDSKYRFSIHNAPVGSGKSLAYIVAALTRGKRVAVLTESKGLMDQVRDDFESVGLYDMRGLSNYTCHALAKGGVMEGMWQKKWGKPTCDVGPCTAGFKCALREQGCDYFDNQRRAMEAQLVSTNNAYWIAIHKYGKGLGKFDALFIDEAHSVDSALNSALAVEFTEKDFRELGSFPPHTSAKIVDWRTWGRSQLMKVQAKLEVFSQSADMGGQLEDDGSVTIVNDSDIPDAAELKMWKRLESKCDMLSQSEDTWIIESTKTGTKISPVWVRNYAESNLFLNIPRVAFFSATVRPKLKSILGIADGQCEYKEYPSVFPVNRRPFYWVPTVSVSHKSTSEELRSWVVRIDNIIARRLDRKGIIHTVSYDKQRYLLANSRFRKIMLFNATGNTKAVVKQFKAAESPAILVSPSVGTGYDFPFDFCRYQIIAKVPFRDKRGAIISAQLKEDPEYADYLTSQDLIQMYGRSNRAANDFSETFCVDDCINTFVKYNKPLFPKYFLDAFQMLEFLPEPPSLLAMAC